MSRQAIAAAFAVLLAGPVAAAPHSPYDAGYRRAIRHGYDGEQASCYGNLFASHAALNSYGQYTIAGGKRRRSPFYALVWQQCRVSL